MALSWADASSYTAQMWDGHERVANIEGLSLQAAREICVYAPCGGLVGRVMSETRDYCEVYTAEGCRKGTWANTTRATIHTAARED